MKGAILTDDNLLSNEMKINLQMLCALILNGVGGKVHDVDVVTVDESAVQCDVGACSSCKSWRNQMASATPLVMARYSTLVLKREMIVCRLADQETRLSPRNTT
jgi:hypothetical protein